MGRRKDCRYAFETCAGRPHGASLHRPAQGDQRAL